MNGPLGPVGAIPESASVAVAVTRTGPFAQPAGRRQATSGGVASTRTVALPASAERIPEPETATAADHVGPSGRTPSEDRVVVDAAGEVGLRRACSGRGRRRARSPAPRSTETA